MTLRLRKWNSATPLIDGQAAVVLDPKTEGSGYFGLSADDTQIPGHYLGKWTINPGNLKMPVDGYIHVIVGPD